ncbi:MAG: OmpP1/FadL family transporter [Desulfobulbus sp.]
MKKRSVQWAAGLIFLNMTALAHAGGLYMYEIGTEDLGLANAGSAARAQDASVIANNPAGMTRLQGNQATVGAQLLYGDLDYTLNDSSLNGPGNVIGWLPGGSAFYSHSINDDLKLGLGLYGNFGLSLDFGDTWSGRNVVKEATLVGMTLQPSLAYRINDKWSVGAGVGINYGIFSLTRDEIAIRGGYEVKQDDTDIAPNAKVGILWEPSDYTRFGLAYTSKVDYDFDVDATVNLPRLGRSWTLPVDAMVDAPQQVMFSAVQVLNNKWTILGEIGWQDWSSFSEAEVTINNLTLQSKLDLQDTWHAAAGVQYQLSAETRLNFGVAYDSSMYSEQGDTSFLLPAGAAWRLGTGVQRQLNDRSSLGAAFEWLLSESADSVSPDVLAGSYDNPQMFFFAINYSYQF